MFAATLSNKLKHTHPRWCSLWSILSGSEKQVTKFNINGLKHGPTHTGAVRFVCFCPSNRAALLVNGNKRERAAAIRWTKRENFAKFDSVQSRGSWVTAATERQLNVFSAADWQRVIKIKSNAQQNEPPSLPPLSLYSCLKSDYRAFSFLRRLEHRGSGSKFYWKQRTRFRAGLWWKMCSWTETVVLRFWPVGCRFTENICLCSDRRFCF